MPSDDRYCRQSRLREVGQAGHAKLVQADLAVVGDAAGEFERDYLLRAGVRSVQSCDRVPPAFVHSQAFRFSSTATVAEGCWRALQQLKEVLRSEST